MATSCKLAFLTIAFAAGLFSCAEKINTIEVYSNTFTLPIKELADTVTLDSARIIVIATPKDTLLNITLTDADSLSQNQQFVVTSELTQTLVYKYQVYAQGKVLLSQNLEIAPETISNSVSKPAYITPKDSLALIVHAKDSIDVQLAFTGDNCGTITPNTLKAAWGQWTDISLTGVSRSCTISNWRLVFAGDFSNLDTLTDNQNPRVRLIGKSTQIATLTVTLDSIPTEQSSSSEQISSSSSLVSSSSTQITSSSSSTFPRKVILSKIATAGSRLLINDAQVTQLNYGISTEATVLELDYSFGDSVIGNVIAFNTTGVVIDVPTASNPTWRINIPAGTADINVGIGWANPISTNSSQVTITQSGTSNIQVKVTAPANTYFSHWTFTKDAVCSITDQVLENAKSDTILDLPKTKGYLFVTPVFQSLWSRPLDAIHSNVTFTKINKEIHVTRLKSTSEGPLVSKINLEDGKETQVYNLPNKCPLCSENQNYAFAPLSTGYDEFAWIYPSSTGIIEQSYTPTFTNITQTFNITSVFTPKGILLGATSWIWYGESGINEFVLGDQSKTNQHSVKFTSNQFKLSKGVFLSSGDFYLFGNTYESGSTNSKGFGYIYYNPSKSLVDAELNTDGAINDAMAISSTEILAAGNKSAFSDSPILYVLNNSTGILNKTNEYSITEPTAKTISVLRKSIDSGYLALLESGKEVYVAKISKDYKLVWYKKLDSIIEGLDVIQAEDGRILVAGRKGYNQGEILLYLVGPKGQ